MRLRLISLIIFIFLFSGKLACKQITPNFLVGTMQKGGTHLMVKFFHILSKELQIKEARNYHIFHLNDIPSKDRIDPYVWTLAIGAKS